MEPLKKLRVVVIFKDIMTMSLFIGLGVWVYLEMDDGHHEVLAPLFNFIKGIVVFLIFLYSILQVYSIRVLQNKERKSAEVERQLSSRLKSLIETPKEVAIYSLDRYLKYTGFNSIHRQEVKEVFGIDLQEGMGYWEIWPSEIKRKLNKNYHRALNGDHFSVTRKFGGRIYMQMFNPIYDGEQITGLTCNIFDITDRVKAQEELEGYKSHLEELVRERTKQLEWQASFFQRVVDNLPNLISVRDSEGRYVLVNQATADSFGVKKEYLIGKDLFETHHDPEEAGFYKRQDQEILTKGTVFEEEINAPWPDGSKKWLVLNKRRMTMGDNYYVLGVHFDITYLKETELKLQEANAKLQRTLNELKATQLRLIESEKMASLGQLTAGLAHEINNPINYVSGNVKPIRNDLHEIRYFIKKSGMKRLNGNSEDQMELLFNELESLLSGVEEGTNRVKSLMNDLFSFSSPDSKERLEYDLNESIKSTINLVKYHLRDRIELKDYLGDIPKILCNPRQLNQVFLNVITNAIQAIPEKGVIHIKTEVEDSYVKILIKDNGVGIPEDSVGKVFDPFFTTKDVGEGTGLGLSISYRIIKEHRGAIEVESEPGKGAEFMIKLPLNTKS